MRLVAGIDCSTQSTKVLVCDADTGAVVRQGRAAHPDGTEIAPSAWWAAYADASDGLLEGVEAISVGGQQHGLICLDADGQVVRPALLWNDTRSAAAATELVAEFGGAQAWAEAVGSVPVASFTVTKLRWLAEAEPAAAARTERVLLPHDWLTWMLAGQQGEPATDRGDASGTGYWSARSGGYRDDIVALAFGRQPGLPRVLEPDAIAAKTSSGVVLGAGTGDNMAAALGVGAVAGDVVVSIGTSGTVFSVSDTPSSDASGTVAGFADATGRYLPLVCTLNAARVLTSTAALLGVPADEFDRLALSAPAGAGGVVLLPYLEGERTPNRPDATGVLGGLRGATMTRANVARAAVEGMLCGLADGLDALRAQGVAVRRVLLIGGGARSAAVQQLAPGIFGADVVVPDPGEYVALGAARQAAWVLGGTAEPPDWAPAHSHAESASACPQVRAQYAAVRDAAG
ncbi:MAG: xylulokinase [Frankiaceae bacterium]|jgi:xylulokinase|nr:xylulokinase [Frankiaceae bacterium]